MKISKTLLLSALAVCVMALPASAVPAFQPDTGNTDQGTLSGTDAIDGALGVNRLFDDTNDNYQFSYQYLRSTNDDDATRLEAQQSVPKFSTNSRLWYRPGPLSAE